MARKNSGRSALVIAGVGFGVAAGVGLGALVLAPHMSGLPVGEGFVAASELQAAQQERDIEAAQAKSADSVISDLADSSVRGVLDGRPVLVLATADADPAVVAEIRRLSMVAGGMDAGRITMTDKFFAQNGADSLKSIIANTLPAGAKLSETNLDPGNHAGEALGAALLLNAGSGEPQATVAERALLLGALREAGFIEYPDGTILPAQAIILVTGNSDGAGEQQFAASQLAQFTRALDKAGNGVVLAGQIRTASDGGAIDLIRTNADAAAEVSTVDSIDRAWAQIAAILAVREQLDGAVGAYGAAASADATLPPIPEVQPQ